MTNPTEQFRAAVQEALEGLREQLGTDSGEPLRRGELSYVEEALASIQASHQQAVKAAQLEILERISSELDELHQGTPGVGWVHYGEIGEYIDGLIKDLSK